METSIRIIVFIAVWVLLAVICFSWTQALHLSRGWFSDREGKFSLDVDSFFPLVCFGPVSVIILLAISFVPPFTKWASNKMKDWV